MRKPKHAIEVLQGNDPQSKEDLAIDRLADVVLKRIADREAKAEEDRPQTEEELSDSVLLQPWCLPREIAVAIRKLISVPHWHKFEWTYEDHGCWKCERKDVPHQSLGHCQNCYQQLLNRVKSSVVKHHAGGQLASVGEMKAALTLKADSARNILAEIVADRPEPISKKSKRTPLPAWAISKAVRRRK